ncbi:N-alpha-acetyltransferase 30-like isoform X2 [Gordionus sp. m RMFG-2023]|uniref:N-alpha-acetyltransferase 30-like isoform X2 n=1 Tax=Gordionus sp. m RMFG-2023 TaxID=3053472 RepID=UPI0031FE294F
MENNDRPDKINCEDDLNKSSYDNTGECQEFHVSNTDLTIMYIQYTSELMMPDIIKLITKDLSEPYSIYTYRYFIHNWPHLCFIATDINSKCIGAIVCKMEVRKYFDQNIMSLIQSNRGYIAMLAVDKEYRRHKIGSKLVLKAIQAMIEKKCDECWKPKQLIPPPYRCTQI